MISLRGAGICPPVQYQSRNGTIADWQRSSQEGNTAAPTAFIALLERKELHRCGHGQKNNDQEINNLTILISHELIQDSDTTIVVS